MKKIFSFVVFTVIAIQSQEQSDKRALEQLLESNVAEISITCFRDKKNTDPQAWREIMIAVNAFIDAYQAAQLNPNLDPIINDQTFQKMHEIIDCMCDFQYLESSKPFELEIKVG